MGKSSLATHVDGIPNSRRLIYPGTSHTGVPKHPRFAPDVIDFRTADSPLTR